MKYFVFIKKLLRVSSHQKK